MRVSHVIGRVTVRELHANIAEKYSGFEAPPLHLKSVVLRCVLRGRPLG